MKTEARFLLAIVLMVGVLVGTNLLFPPAPPPEEVSADSVGVGRRAPGVDTGMAQGRKEAVEGPTVPGVSRSEPTVPVASEVPAKLVRVEGPLYALSFTSRGARLESAELEMYPSLRRQGPVQLLPDSVGGYLGQRIVVGADTLDLSELPFSVQPEEGIVLDEGGEDRSLRFVYEHPTVPFRFEVEYRFHPGDYVIDVSGRVTGVERPLLVTDLGDGLAFNEADSASEARSMAYVADHVQDGVRSWSLSRPGRPRVEEGPFLWAATRSKYFVLALLSTQAVEGEEADLTGHLGGLIISESRLEGRVRVGVAQTPRQDGTFEYRLYMGPQELALMSSLGQDLEQVNPYGWKFFRPIVRPFVSIITAILVFLHRELSLAYGWVLILFGVAMRVVLFPLNHKAMRAQLRNMAVQPLVQEIQAKYKDNPEKLQKEMMKLYKEHGFNPLAGCLPMLLPFPVLIALFFVFQNTIELRGVPFLWLPDLSAHDPLYVLPVFLGLSMFLMQWVNMRAVPQGGSSAQMKYMMYLMPIFMVFVFFRLASGLNLYYAVANLATIPQQVWIANERKKVQQKGGAVRAKGDEVAQKSRKG